jgi:hypothetical protein
LEKNKGKSCDDKTRNLSVNITKLLKIIQKSRKKITFIHLISNDKTVYLISLPIPPPPIPPYPSGLMSARKQQ